MFYRIRKLYKDTIHWYLGDWGYFMYDIMKHEKNLRRNFYKESSMDTLSQKTAIYMANGFCGHAGIADRFKGITTLYGLCKEADIDFKICHKHPFELSDYLIPNQYDWRISSDQICYNRKQVSVNYFMLHPLVQQQIDSGEIIELEHQWVLQRIAEAKTNQLHFYTNMYPKSDAMFGAYFRELFKPSLKVEQELQYHMHQIGGRYISVSYRFMQLLGDFKDCEGVTLVANQQETLIKKSMDVLLLIKKENPTIDRILVTADSVTFLQAAKKLPFVYVIDGKVGHINYVSSDEVNMKTFLDFFMIAHADIVYLAKSEKMYNSEFARRASMIYSKQFELIKY